MAKLNMYKMTFIYKYILYTTIFSLFCQALRVYYYGVDLKVFYLIIIINYFLIFVVYGISFKASHLLILFLIFIPVLFKENSPFFKKSLLTILGISFISTYYYQFFRVRKIDLDSIFRIYAKLSYWLALLGLFIYMYKYYNHNYRSLLDLRLQSLMTEPANFCMIVLPAMYYYWKVYSIKNKYFLVILASIILSVSTLGYLGLFIALIISGSLKKWYKYLLLIPVALLLFYFAYSLSTNVKMRFDDTLKAILNQDLSRVNISTYSVLSNTYVAFRSVIDNPLTGGGAWIKYLFKNKIFI